MKYLLTPWKAVSGKHELLVDNEHPTKTTRIRGYGFGVTFSSWCFKWNHTFSSNADFLKFSDPVTSANTSNS
jgi:hypothetical protein